MSANSTDRKPGLDNILTQTPFCRACEGEIPSLNVLIKPDRPDAPGHTERTIQAYCEHCDILYQQRQRLRGGEWVSLGSSVVLRDALSRSCFFRKTASNRLERQIAHAG